MMSSRQLALALALFVLPASAAAQDTGAPEEEPAASQPIGTIPSDFRLESREENQAEPGPVAPSIPAPTASSTPNAQETPARAQPVVTPPPAVVVPQQAPELTPRPVPSASTSTEPTGSPDPVSGPPPEQPAGEAADVGPSLDVGQPDRIAEAGEQETQDGTNVWLPWLGGLALMMLVGVALWRRRQGTAETEIDRPEVAQAAPKPQPVETDQDAPPPPPRERPMQPVPQPTEAPKLVTIGSLVSKKDVNPSTLVSTKPRSGGFVSAPASGQQPPAPAPVAGGVTTNLAAKRKAEAEALEKARQDAQKRRQAARPTVKRSISFDWS